MAYISFDSLKNSVFNDIFCFEKEFMNLSYYTGTFLVGAHWFGAASPKLQTFSGIFWVLEIFVCLCICEVTTKKVNFCFYKQCSQATTFLICKQPIFAQNASIVFSSIPLYIEKNPVENLCKLLEMELKTNTPVGPKFVFEKVIFKVLHFIQHNFIQKHPGLGKDQTIMFKSRAINYFDWRCWNTFKNILQWLYKRWQILLFYKSRCGIFNTGKVIFNTGKSYLSHQTKSNILWKDQVWLIKF